MSQVSNVMPPFHIVLIEPEIPQNTGTIGRLCVATSAVLHLIEPLGFELTESRVRRAGLDYWEHLTLVRHASMDHFLESLPADANMVLFETRGGPTLYDYSIQPGSYLIFGKETSGIPEYVLNRYAGNTVRIPMFDARVRSLNLSNTVSIALYEAIRQTDYHV